MSSTKVSRRSVLGTLAYSIGASRFLLGGISGVIDSHSLGWTKEWDTALLSSQILAQGRSYDPSVQLVKVHRGPEYSYQTHIRNRTVHPTRDSLQYASLLLYQDGTALVERAVAVINRVLSLQVSDRASRYFGLWGWYMEEPPDQMPAADFNWADFNGATLLNILFEHENKLPTEVAGSCREALQACAVSIRKRNVNLDYTNIAFQGTYVTLATAELLNNPSLLAYAKDRLVRLESTVAVSGSFVEYNSPTYMAVTISNLSRILKYVQDADARQAGARLNALAWKHVAKHWHQPTLQLAGPMSRAYSNNIGAPMWIQKGTNNRVQFMTLQEIGTKETSEDVSVPTLDWQCPEELIETFISATRRQHREVFIAGSSASGEPISTLDGPKPVGATLPVEGTTLLTPNFSLGTIDRCDCWGQRRNLIAYWGGTSRPPQCLQLRVVKDDYDFTSALFYAAQDQGYVLGAIRFQLDGGDKHPSLDPVKDRTITLSRLQLELLFERWDTRNSILVDGKPQQLRSFTVPAMTRIAIETGGVKIIFQARDASFIGKAQNLHFSLENGDAKLAVELMRTQKPQTVHLTDLISPGCDFVFQIDDSDFSLAKVDSIFAASLYTQITSGDVRETSWRIGSSSMSLSTSTTTQSLAKQYQSFDITANSKPYPFVRLGAV
jgi:hypothetical protein